MNIIQIEKQLHHVIQICYSTGISHCLPLLVSAWTSAAHVQPNSSFQWTEDLLQLLLLCV